MKAQEGCKVVCLCEALPTSWSGKYLTVGALFALVMKNRTTCLFIPFWVSPTYQDIKKENPALGFPFFLTATDGGNPSLTFISKSTTHTNQVSGEEMQLCNVRGNLHPHLRGKWGQWREGTTGQNDAANTLIYQIVHAEARREAPVTQNVAYKVQRKT